MADSSWPGFPVLPGNQTGFPLPRILSVTPGHRFPSARKHSLGGKGRGDGGGGGIDKDTASVLAGIQFFPEPLRYHITAFRPSGKPPHPLPVPRPGIIEAEHTRILAQPALHKALRQPGAQFISSPLLDADRNLNLRILLWPWLLSARIPRGRRSRMTRKGGLPHIPFTGQKEPNHHLFHRLPPPPTG